MSLNLNARTKRVEALFNPAEVELLDTVRGPVDRSSYLRGLMHAAARTHGIPPAPPKESRQCPGHRKPHVAASRGKAAVSMRRNF